MTNGTIESCEMRPELSLYPVPRPDGSIALLIRNINDSMVFFLNCERKKSYKDLPVGTLFEGDSHIVDEWVEYAVRIHAKPTLGNYDHGEDGKYTKTILQFYSAKSQWRLTTILYDTNNEQVEIFLERSRQDWQQISSWQWREMYQSNRIAKESHGGFYWEICLREKWIFISKGFAAILGISDEAAVIPISKFMEYLYPTDVQVVVNALQCVSEGQVTFYSRACLPDGTTAYFNTVAVPSYDREGNYTRILGRASDITQMRRAMEKLEVSESRFRNIVENSADLFVTLDAGGVITYVSPNIRAMLGKPPQKVVGNPFYTLLDRFYKRDMLVTRLQQMVEGRIRQSFTVLAQHKNGCTVWLRVGLSVVVDAEDRVVEVSCICRDFTVERLQQEELKYMASHDYLTGVYNRVWFETELLRIQKEQETSMGLIMADLNGLRLINDAFGHNRGDEMLVRAARLFQEVGGGSQVARIGGDEFAIILREVSPAEVERVFRAIIANNVQELQCQEEDAMHIPLSVSCGLAYRSSIQDDILAIHELAEERMYQNKLLESRSLHSQVIASLREALKSHNVETSDHMERMEKMMLALGERLGLSTSEFDRLVLLASLHDIGKVAIPHNIINKPGPLTEEEWTVMRSHSEVGGRIAMSSQELSCIADEICYHHERWDGSGYPDGRRGEEIPLLARIVSVVDTYDVMTNRRVYKEPIDHREAIEELQRCAGSQFDPWIVEMFVDVMREWISSMDGAKVAAMQR